MNIAAVLSLDMSGYKLLAKKWLAPHYKTLERYWIENFDTTPSGKRKVILS